MILVNASISNISNPHHQPLKYANHMIRSAYVRKHMQCKPTINPGSVLIAKGNFAYGNWKKEEVGDQRK